MKPCDSSNDEDDNDDDDTEGHDVSNNNAESIVSTVTPVMKLNGKWTLKGWPVFVAYVCCRHTVHDAVTTWYTSMWVKARGWINLKHSQEREKGKITNHHVRKVTKK